MRMIEVPTPEAAMTILHNVALWRIQDIEVFEIPL
jgi:hypothetical protein